MTFVRQTSEAPGGNSPGPRWRTVFFAGCTTGINYLVVFCDSPITAQTGYGLGEASLSSELRGGSTYDSRGRSHKFCGLSIRHIQGCAYAEYSM